MRRRREEEEDDEDEGEGVGGSHTSDMHCGPAVPMQSWHARLARNTKVPKHVANGSTRDLVERFV